MVHAHIFFLLKTNDFNEILVAIFLYEKLKFMVNFHVLLNRR